MKGLLVLIFLASAAHAQNIKGEELKQSLSKFKGVYTLDEVMQEDSVVKCENEIEISQNGNDLFIKSPGEQDSKAVFKLTQINLGKLKSSSSFFGFFTFDRTKHKQVLKKNGKKIVYRKDGSLKLSLELKEDRLIYSYDHYRGYHKNINVCAYRIAK